MELAIKIILGAGVYLIGVLILSRCMSINSIQYAKAKTLKFPKYPVNKPFPLMAADRRRLERRKRQAPIAADRRSGYDRRLLINQNGAVIVVVTVCMATFMLGFVYLALDTGIISVSKAESQNCADAAALAGSNSLYEDIEQPEFCLMTEAAAVASDLAAANGCDSCTVTLGHWSHASGTFDPGSLGSVPDWQNATAEILDTDLFYTNSVSVECAVNTENTLSGYGTTGVTKAVAMVRVKENPEGQGMIRAPGSGLVK